MKSKSLYQHRLNGQAEPSPGLKPQADALGKAGQTSSRPESAGRGDAVLTTSNKTPCYWEGREGLEDRAE